MQQGIKKTITATILATTMLSGCATMIRGTEQEVSVNTIPEGADIRFNNGKSCVSPCTIKAKRDHPLQVVIVKDDCRQHVVNLVPSISGSAMLMGGFMDHFTGAAHDLHPNPLNVNLLCGEQAALAARDEQEREIKSQSAAASAASARAHAAITPSNEARSHPNYEKDLYECDWYATSKRTSVVGNTLVGAAVGAGVSAAVGAIFGVGGDFVGSLAGAGALTGGLSSGANALASNNARYSQVMVQCMRDKGHHVY